MNRSLIYNLKKVSITISQLLLLLVWSGNESMGQSMKNAVISVCSNNEIYSALKLLQPGDTLCIENGIYNNIHLIVNQSGEAESRIYMKARNPGKVFFSGDAKVELRGDYLVLDGIYFANGDRNVAHWKPHGPGLVAIYGSYNRVTQCAFNAFDQANSAYITTSIPKDGTVPRYCRIDHCSFINKITFDQVINLNNTRKAITDGSPGGPPMYHRIDHCFFSNPKKPGNAGGAIRIGYYRNDTGRCLVDSCLFMRQDSEPEIITSKSQENVYYANTFLNCRGTFNFRHGDHQVAINNFFISTDNKYYYGGMFVWGSGHIIADNYFDLQTTDPQRGSAAIALNPGSEATAHALAFDIVLVNNFFNNINGYAINFDALEERRKEFCAQYGYVFQEPYDLTFTGNVFFSNAYKNLPFFNENYGRNNTNMWENNFAYGKALGIKPITGINSSFFKLNNSKNGSFCPSLSINYHASKLSGIKPIDGIQLNLNSLINRGIRGKPLTPHDVGPVWLKDIPGQYALTAKLPQDVQKKFQEVINRETIKVNYSKMNNE